MVNMKQITPEYSVIIRTTGKAEEKYAELLESINNLEPVPKEIIVVLPEGYDPPKETLGREKIYFCKKGMVSQRICGIEKCSTRYALITDDDIAFGPDFVRKLSEPVISGEYGFSAGPLLDFLPQKGCRALVSALMGGAVPTLFHKDRYNSVLKTTGFSYNRKIEMGTGKRYETQTAPWTCFFADLKAFEAIHFEDEIWLDAHGYAALDDETMFYKGWLCGFKSVIVADASYRHLNAKTSAKGNAEAVRYCSGYNTVVFGQRFLCEQCYNEGGRLWCSVCINYRLLMQRLYNNIDCLRKRTAHEEKRAFVRGIKDAKKWIRTEEYMRLPQIRC